MDTGGTRTDQWSSLPKDLLTTIADRLGTRMYVRRLRAVCTSWRSSIPLFPNNSPRFPLKLPHPKSSKFINTCLTERTIYRLEPLLHQHQHQDDGNNGWLVKVEEWKPGHFLLLNPLSHHQIRYIPETFPKKLNLLNYRVFELGKTYCLEYLIPYPGFDPDKAIYSADESAVLLVYAGGMLAFLRLGDVKWTQLGNISPIFSHCTDIMLYNGKFHAIDNWGQVVMIDSSTLKLRKVWDRLLSNGRKKRFVQSSGDLYVMVGGFDDEEDDYRYFKIYKLNETSWVEVTRLEDRVAFLGEDCSLLASAEQLAGCERNCIYFSDNKFIYHSKYHDDVLKGLHRHNTCLFKLVGRSMWPLSTGPANFQVFWPPPTWLEDPK